MAEFNSSQLKATFLRTGILQVARTLVASVLAITAILVLAGIVLGLTGCSKEKSEESSINSKPAEPRPAAANPPPAKVNEARTTRRRRPVKSAPTLTYSNSIYGLSFRFPSQYELTTPATNNEKSSLAEDVPKNFTLPGGVTVATLELPRGSATSFFSVSANKGLSSAECEQFSIPAPSDLAVHSPLNQHDTSIPSKTTIHGLDFTQVENASEQEDVKYYHHFEPTSAGIGGTCYEFALGVEQSRVSSRTLSDPALLAKLEGVLATVEIRSAEGSRVAASVQKPAPSF
jgi:hypothetical protein